MRKLPRVFALILILCMLASLLTACGSKRAELTEAERAAAEEFLGGGVLLEDITGKALNSKKTDDEKTSVKKVFKTQDGKYVFFASPAGYNGPIDLMLIIDGTTAKTTAMKVIRHMETDHYVRDFDSDWFTGRFVDKSAFAYLYRVKLEAENPCEIIAITGATVTTDGCVNGVNDCFEVFQSLDNPYYEGPSGEVTLTVGSEKAGAITAGELEKLDSYRRRIVIHSASEGDTTHDFRGVRLSEAIDLVDKSLLRDCSEIIAIGIDGYSAPLTAEEVLLENNVYLMYEDNGEPIKDFTGREGAYRLIVLNDDYGQRFTNFLQELKFIK